jgi:hypothetical protein
MELELPRVELAMCVLQGFDLPTVDKLSGTIVSSDTRDRSSQLGGLLA